MRVRERLTTGLQIQKGRERVVREGERDRDGEMDRERGKRGGERGVREGGVRIRRERFP